MQWLSVTILSSNPCTISLSICSSWVWCSDAVIKLLLGFETWTGPPHLDWPTRTTRSHGRIRVATDKIARTIQLPNTAGAVKSLATSQISALVDTSAWKLERRLETWDIKRSIFDCTHASCNPLLLWRSCSNRLVALKSMGQMESVGSLEWGRSVTRN